MIFRNLTILLLAIFSIGTFVTNAFAVSETEKTFLSLYFKDEELVIISSTRSLQSITRIAENIEIVTSGDIELMNAHTLPEVLSRVTGVQVQFGGPNFGSTSYPLIQAAAGSHVVVLIDGIAVNSLGSGVATLLPTFPVQAIAKVEIIKGPASSVWGSALGGIINIITKTGESFNAVNGTLTTSYGERGTSDFGAEVYGTKGKLSYYLFAGDLRTDALRRNFDLLSDRVYSRLSYEITPDTKVMFTVYYHRDRRGEGDDLATDLLFSDRDQNLVSSLALQSRLSRELTMDLSLYARRQTFKSYLNQLSNGSELGFVQTKDLTNGVSSNLTWLHDMHAVVAGIDYDRSTIRTDTILDKEQSRSRWGVFINDTIALGRVSITPGIRYDHITTTNGFVSPSLGTAYQAARDVLLRATIARASALPFCMRYGVTTHIIRPTPASRSKRSGHTRQALRPPLSRTCG